MDIAIEKATRPIQRVGPVLRKGREQVRITPEEER